MSLVDSDPTRVNPTNVYVLLHVASWTGNRLTPTGFQAMGSRSTVKTRLSILVREPPIMLLPFSNLDDLSTTISTARHLTVLSQLYSCNKCRVLDADSTMVASNADTIRR